MTIVTSVQPDISFGMHRIPFIFLEKSSVMAKVVPLFSSSKGNSFYIQGNESAVLIDAGRSCKQIELMMMRNSVSMNNVKALLVTHEHSDHISALNVLIKRYRIPVYATRGTLDALIDYEKIDFDREMHEVRFDEDFDIGGFKVSALKTSHDARESCGFSMITPDGRKISLITDTGIFMEDARLKARGSDFLIIESNHDIEMLKQGPYPFVLKRRILSGSGHLSNDDCAKELPAFVNSGVRQILLSHLSEHNNTPALALACSINALKNAGYELERDYLIYAAPPESTGKSYSF